MRRRVLAGLAALCALLAVPAAAGAIVISPATHVSVRPAKIHPHTAVRVSFRQPAPGGLLPDQRIVERLRVTGPARATGCIHSAALTIAPLAAGRMIHRALRPGNITRWCLGRFHGQITLSSGPICNPGPIHTLTHVCPMYIVAPRTIATFGFRVTPSSRFHVGRG
jgi:hypothetical protein